jgi:hypothetical protein
MNMPLKIGAEPRKMVILVVLLLAAGGIYYWNSRDSKAAEATVKPAGPPRASLKQALQSPQSAEVEADSAAKITSPAAGETAAREFRPSLKRKSGVEVNPEQFDPTLRTDLLDKLAAVRIEHVERSLFDFSTASSPARPQLPAPKIVVQKPAPRMIGPEPAPPPPAPPVKPPPPPITLKFYGRALPLKGGVKRVFCLVNDEVKIPAEGDILQKRYKIRNIMPTSVVVEDLQYKHEQKLPIEEPAPGSQ